MCDLYVAMCITVAACKNIPYCSMCVSGHTYVNRGRKTCMAGTVNSVLLSNVRGMETCPFSKAAALLPIKSKI